MLAPINHPFAAFTCLQKAPQPLSTDSPYQLVPQNGTSSGSNLSAAPGANAGPAKVNVHFEVPEYLTHWGQVLKVVGSLDELGNWKVEKVWTAEH